MCPGLWRNDPTANRHQNLEDFSQPASNRHPEGLDSLQNLEDGTWVYLQSRARDGGRNLELRSNQKFPAKLLSRDDIRVMNVLMPQQAARHKVEKSCVVADGQPEMLSRLPF